MDESLKFVQSEVDSCRMDLKKISSHSTMREAAIGSFLSMTKKSS